MFDDGSYSDSDDTVVDENQSHSQIEEFKKNQLKLMPPDTNKDRYIPKQYVYCWRHLKRGENDEKRIKVEDKRVVFEDALYHLKIDETNVLRGIRWYTQYVPEDKNMFFKACQDRYWVIRLIGFLCYMRPESKDRTESQESSETKLDSNFKAFCSMFTRLNLTYQVDEEKESKEYVKVFKELVKQTNK